MQDRLLCNLERRLLAELPTRVRIAIMWDQSS
jgi:hypothetical protein